MQIEVQRSGLTEAVHQVAAVAVAADGSELAAIGDPDRRFWLRSAAKPFQAAASQRLGADLDLPSVAVASASHDGDPVHLAYVQRMLSEADLSEDDLACPPAWPLGGSRRVAASGHTRPRRLWHNCSGKHAAMLRACRAQGWDHHGYTSPDHPLQQAIASEMADVLDHDPGPVGVDGCGVPVFAGSVRSLATAFRRLAEPTYQEVLTALHRFPALASGVGNPDATTAIWLGAAAKRGAEGCLGLVSPGHGALGLKVWDGASRATGPALAELLGRLGWIPHGIADRLLAALEVPVMGGGARVGTVQARRAETGGEPC